MNTHGMADRVVRFLAIFCILSSVNLMILPEVDDLESNDKCSMAIIKNVVKLDSTLTVVNINNNEFASHLHLLNVKLLTRAFFAKNIDEPNEAYILRCDHYDECHNGLDDLEKDRYWNPTAVFIITIRNMVGGPEEFFRKLHHLYIFKTILVTHNNIYLYDFDAGNHCTFTPEVITKYDCENIKLDHTKSTQTWTAIIKTLEERDKVPYSECNVTVTVLVIVPFIFPPEDGAIDPIGYEEEFISILKRMNFTKLEFLYDMNLAGTGTVYKNFSTSGALRDVQMGRSDYVIGGSILSHRRMSAFDFTYPHWCDDFIMIVPKAREIDKWEVMYTIFHPLVWGLIILTFLCVTLVAFTMKKNSKSKCIVLLITTFEMFSYLTNNGPKRNTGYLIILWAFFAWLITCFYQCNLSSIFTKPAYYNEVDSFDEIFTNKFKLCLNHAKYNFLMESRELNLRGYLESSTILETNQDCLKAVVSARRSYTLSSRLSFQYHDTEFHRDDGEAMLHRVREPYFYIFRTGFLRKGNPNIKRIRLLEEQIIAYGFHRRSLLAFIHKNKLKYYKVKKNLSKSLSSTDVAGIYYIYVGGCGLALLTFLFEWIMGFFLHFITIFVKIVRTDFENPKTNK